MHFPYASAPTLYQVSAADLLQMAGAAAVQVCGGPHIRLRYGRKQTENSEHCCGEARSKSAATAAPPFQDGETAVEHVRRVFSRMGFNDAEAVALMGAHTLGRAHRSRSGHGAPHTPYTKNAAWARPRGGSSWTADWDRFDNGYFRELMASKHDEHLLKLPTDLALLQDQSFREHVKRFAEDENVFFREYAAAHVRMSEAGALFDPPKGIYVDLSKKSSKT
jgi:L-ascorbate peroxidase